MSGSLLRAVQPSASSTTSLVESLVSSKTAQVISSEDNSTVETKTTSQKYNIDWDIDESTLRISRLALKGDKRGVIEMNVPKDGHQFKLELCASGWRNSQDGYCAFYLTVPNQEEEFVGQYQVKVGDIKRTSSIRDDFHLGVGFPNFCTQDTLTTIMENGLVRFTVTVEVFSRVSCVHPPKEPLRILTSESPNAVLSKLMGSMLKERMFTDFELVCRGWRFPVHRCVLAHASPVFAAMFKRNFVEKRERVAHIHADPNTVRAMVDFLYTAKISHGGSNESVSDHLMNVDESASSSSSSSLEYENDLSSPSSSPLAHPTAASALDDDGDAEVQGLDVDDDALMDARDEDDDDDDDERDERRPRLSLINQSRHSSISDSSIESQPLPFVQDGTDTKTDDNEIVMNHSSSESISDSTTIPAIPVPDHLQKGSDQIRSEKILYARKTVALFELAHQFSIHSLSIACCEQLYRELTVESACDLLIRFQLYRDVHEIALIGDAIWDFVIDNIREIEETSGYASLVQHKFLVKELVKRLANKITS